MERTEFWESRRRQYLVLLSSPVTAMKVKSLVRSIFARHFQPSAQQDRQPSTAVPITAMMDHYNLATNEEKVEIIMRFIHSPATDQSMDTKQTTEIVLSTLTTALSIIPYMTKHSNSIQFIYSCSIWVFSYILLGSLQASLGLKANGGYSVRRYTLRALVVSAMLTVGSFSSAILVSANGLL